MNADVETTAPRPRPLSGGLWTLFSWLRRDESSSSSDSLSSVGSDCTTVSFAFLKPTHYNTSVPIILPPPGPPTDSYKKRVIERDNRRLHDRDLTLRRKYGLYRNECGSSYDAFSLPPVKSTCGVIRFQERDRRATSECLQRRTVHVPGKRRAPLPPGRAASAEPTSLNRTNKRKRPAPQPPTNFPHSCKENIHVKFDATHMSKKMNSSISKGQAVNNDVAMDSKLEKCNKKRVNKDSKTSSEKNFLKQLFDNKKRHSTVDTSTIKILPSISELDKQAADIIESYKVKALKQDGLISKKTVFSQFDVPSSSSVSGSWFCTQCLRKYNPSQVTCLYCTSEQKKALASEITHNKSASNNTTQTIEMSAVVPSSIKMTTDDEKRKLKEMLKEMKDSLPKRPKQDNKNDVEISNKTHLTDFEKVKVTEAPTLRIGSIVRIDDDKKLTGQRSQPNNIVQKSKKDVKLDVKITPKALIKNPVSIDNHIQSFKLVKKDENIIEKVKGVEINSNVPSDNNNLSPHIVPKNCVLEKTDLHTPLRISSLLNPVYIPKNITHPEPVEQNIQMKSHGVPLQNINSKVTSVKHCASAVSTSNVDPVTINTSATNQVQFAHKIENQKPRGNKNTEIKDSSPINFSANKSVQGICSTSTQTVSSPKNNVDQIRKCILEQSKVNPSPLNIKVTRSPVPENLCKNLTKCQNAPGLLADNNKIPVVPNINVNNNNLSRLDQHIRRRQIINVLEQSIAKGDQQAAAEAAAKLAQLRLSCSVLSFSSQIVNEPSPSGNEVKEIDLQKQKSARKGPVSVKSDTVQANLKKDIKEPDIPEKLSASVNTTNVFEEEFPSNKEKVINPSLSPQPSTSRQDSQNNSEPHLISISIWVEDREATRGPVRLRIQRKAVMGDLRRQAAISLGLAAQLQRWIVGRALCTDDNTPLVSLAGPDLSAPFYLCLVENDATKENLTKDIDKDDKAGAEGQSNVYTELVQLEQQALISNSEEFECGVCLEKCITGRGTVLRECVHTFCNECLSDLVRHCEEPAISCPAMGCSGVLQEREIRALVSPEEYERWLARGLAAAESGTRNSFHCRTRDCTGWALCEPGVQRFPCPVCKRINCLSCQAIHEGETCEEHRKKLQEVTANADANKTDEGTQALLDNLIARGEALKCPECSAIITKKWGCDWIKCSACKTEICWVTRGRRWGPAGRGDTSAGCRCGLDGNKCHPSCGYCH